MKTALVHDWLVTRGGAENVLEEIYNLYPSPIFTLLHNNLMPDKTVHTSFLQKVPFASSFHRYLLPLFPTAIEQFDLSEFDLILSSSHAVAKGVKRREGQLHICYCHTPMRYAWDLEKQYVEGLGSLKRVAAKAVLKRLRNWDLKSSDRVDEFIANSCYVKSRIERVYGREAQVIYPPVATDRFFLSKQKEDFYVTLCRLVSYKRVDVMVEAFRRMPHRKLIVIGDGPEREKLEKMAPPNVEFKRGLSDEQVARHLSVAKGFIFAAEEDFGIAPVEAQASGTAVIAYGKGGVLESVVEGKTGLFFKEQTAQSLEEAVERFERCQFDGERVQEQARKFGVERFRREFKHFIDIKIS
jgi:glycosyltransferase involved in cell wall biosynthesis